MVMENLSTVRRCAHDPMAGKKLQKKVADVTDKVIDKVDDS
jgi:hypothetical protein